MSIPGTAPSPLPDVARLRARQQMAMDCALCARPLGASGRRLGEVRHWGLPFQLWACAPNCEVAGSTIPTI
ncbi:hypothetical protein ABT173_13690 [Streptomyces sp. NPDC001795]|uniref:hypothetical protein n=1 Tax=unclassified Streptomyces TaxID=2593676 RepID=UPI00332B0E21